MREFDNKKHIFFVTGGGTGGHIYPALAVARELQKNPLTKKVYYVGNPDNLEYEIVKQEGFEFLPVKVKGMPRKLSLKLFTWFVGFEWAKVKALYYIFKYKASAVFGTGGYVSAPALFAAGIAKVPFMIHDSDAMPGIVSRYVSKYANAVSLSFGEATKYIESKNIFINGNPIREDFATLSKEDARQKMNFTKRTITFIGGSQGAKTINEAAFLIVRKLVEENDFQVVFQTGKKNFADITEKLSCVWPDYSENKNLLFVPYIEDMTAVLKSADLIISRAGSLSISEICACGVPSILVPYPYAAADHQRKNAMAMKNMGASEYIEDKDCNPDFLYEKILEIVNNQDKYNSMANIASQNAKYSAVKDIVNQFLNIIKK